METLIALLVQVLHIALVLAAAPLLVGYVRLLKARLLGRVGPPLVQPWRDLLRLARKQPVLAENASFLFAGAPAVSFAATLAAAALVPTFAFGMTTAPIADLLLIAGLLTLGRCTLALAGMDIGTAFGGIGASREMTFSVFAEPALLLVIFTLALLAGTTNLDVIATLLREGTLGLRVSLGLALVAIVIVAIAENGRIPVDNPATHLELTMVHEAMVLEYSGRHLALIEWGASLRLLLWLTLICTIFVPFGAAQATGWPVWWLTGALAWVAKILVLATALGLFETSVAKMRVFRVPEFLGIALLLGLLAAIFLFVSQGFA
jgi:formate hydrogenlyase subunit 4